MQEEALETVLRRLEAAGIFGEAKPCGDEYYSIPCPFAKWKHKNGEDNRPSATVSFGEGRSVLRCHSCGMRENLDKAVSMLNDLHGGLSSALTAEVAQIEKEQKISIKPRHKKEKPPKDHLELLRPMLKAPFTAQAKQLFKRKNVPLIVAKKFYCAYVKEYEYPRKKKPIGVRNAVLFPMLARIGDQIICPGAQVRPLDAGPDDLKYYTLFPFKPASARFLFGEHLIHMVRRKKLFIVEGALDAMHIWSVKHRAFALFGLYISSERAKKIKAAGARKVYILLDPDQNEEETPFKAQENLRKEGVEADVLHSEVDPSQLSKEDLDNF